MKQLQQNSGSSSSDNEVRFGCPKCTKTFTDNRKFMDLSDVTVANQ
jgi:hypothetical protein